MKIKVSISRPYGSIELESESLNEIIEALKQIAEQIDAVDGLVCRPLSKRSLPSNSPDGKALDLSNNSAWDPLHEHELKAPRRCEALPG